MTTDAKAVQVPLWRVRLGLFGKSLRTNWAMFSENPIGLLGLGVIVSFGLFALAHPILISTVWDPNIYDPVSGFDLEVPIHPSSPSARHLLGTDPLGRDVLSQLMYSTRFEFALGILASWTFIAIPLRRETARLGALTLPDYFELRFNDRSRALRIVSMVVILFFYTVYVAAQLHGAGKILHATFEVPQLWGIVIGASVVVFYTLMGGMVSVVLTDFAQFVLLSLGFLLGTYFILTHPQLGWTNVVASVEERDDRIVAICIRDGERQAICLLDLAIPSPPPSGAEWIEAYRNWSRF